MAKSQIIHEEHDKDVMEANEYLTSNYQELKECQCPGCGGPLTSFNFLFCLSCLDMEVSEFQKLAFAFSKDE